MIFNISGGGGTALNFRVVGNPQPANPSENCIWVNTDVPITSWIFSAEEPSSAEAGMVWFLTGTSSSVEFNALRKNGIQVYPQSAKQYVSGAWENVTAMIYQGGEWKTFELILFPENGESGQWVAKAFNVAGSSTAKMAPSISLSDNEMVCTLDLSGTTDYKVGSVFYDKTLNLKNKNTITVKYSLSIPTTTQYSEGNAHIYVADKMQDGFTALASVRLSTGSNQTVDLSISDIGDADCYLCFSMYAGRTKNTLTIEEFKVS